MLSIREEVKQDLINKSVTVDVQAGVTTTRLPLMDNPLIKLTPNEKLSHGSIYISHVKKLSKCEKDKRDVIAKSRSR